MRHQKLLRDLGWIAGIVAFSGCFNPDKNGLDGGESDATGSSGGGGTMNDDAPEDDGPDGSGPGTDGETGPNDETTSPGTEEGTTQGETDTGSNAACGDGNVDAGELCLPAEPTTFDTAAGSRYIAVGFLNPNLDIVTSSQSAFELSIMMGNGAGGFASPTTRVVGTPDNNDGPLGLTLGDLDDDDDVDILALSYNNLTWFLNNGAGQFSGSGNTHQAGGFTSRGHVFIDNVDASPAGDILYSDGYGICVALGALDVDNVYSISAGAEASCNQRLQICEDGFVVPTEFGFDGDGYRDLLIGAAFSSEVGQGRGNGNGTFTLSECSVGTNVCGREQCDMSYINAADLDDDGEVDLVASHDQGISVLLGNDDGTYADPTFHDTGASEETRFADMNGDGYLDIVVASAGESAIAVLLGTGNGDFEAPVFFAAGAEVFSVAVGDANNDDAPDLFTVHGTPDAGTVVVFLSDP